MTHHEMMEYRLAGLSYQAIANKAGVSRQRIQQILRPPASVCQWVGKQANWCCQSCKINIGTSGHVHHREHKGLEQEDYQDIQNLEYLCIVCHGIAHSDDRPYKDYGGYTIRYVQLEQTLYTSLAKWAKREERSLHAQIVWILRRAVEEDYEQQEQEDR
jgi:hypothetical protein